MFVCCSCGALSVGDQILSIDDTVIEHSSYSPEEVMALLDTNTGRGYTQLQIMPSHTLARRGNYIFHTFLLHMIDRVVRCFHCDDFDFSFVIDG